MVWLKSSKQKAQTMSSLFGALCCCDRMSDRSHLGEKSFQSIKVGRAGKSSSEPEGRSLWQLLFMCRKQEEWELGRGYEFLRSLP